MKEVGRGGGGHFCTIFRVVFDFCHSFFVPKPHRNACYAGYLASYEAMFTLYRKAFAPARKQYRIRFLFTHKNGDFGAKGLLALVDHVIIFL